MFGPKILIFLTGILVLDRPLSEDEARIHTPVVISCNEQRREVAATQSIAGKHIDRHFAFDKVIELNKSCCL